MAELDLVVKASQVLAWDVAWSAARYSQAAGHRQENHAAQRQGRERHPQGREQERDVQEARIEFPIGKSVGRWRAGFVAAASADRLATEREQSENPEREHRPGDQHRPDHVPRADDRPDQHLNQAQEEQFPVLGDRLRPQDQDDLQIDQPVPQRQHQQFIVLIVFGDRDPRHDDRRDVQPEALPRLDESEPFPSEGRRAADV